MIITKEINSATDFEFWSGAKDTVAELTTGEANTIISMLDDMYPDGMTETELNDFFWFERDIIAEWLGYTDFDCIVNKNKYGDEVTVRIYDIVWDVDDEDDDCIELPTEVIYIFDYNGDNDELEENISGWLSDEYEYYPDSFKYDIQEEK